jgi:hypothetical protein
MTNPRELLHRRQLLKSTTGMLTGLVVAGSPLAALAQSSVWAIDLTALGTADAATLTVLARTLFPHDQLDDLAYAQVVHALDSEAAKSENMRNLLSSGLHQLPGDFAKLSEAERVAALKKIESTEFFQTMRQKIVQLLYAGALAYTYFGYQGEAFSKGGYLLRGFNDLHWLPDVPAVDSGPLPVNP